MLILRPPPLRAMRSGTVTREVALAIGRTRRFWRPLLSDGRVRCSKVTMQCVLDAMHCDGGSAGLQRRKRRMVLLTQSVRANEEGCDAEGGGSKIEAT